METFEITTLSSKAQVVIPGNIRKELKVKEGTKFAVISDGENILLKKIETPVLKEFKNLIEKSRKAIQNKNIKKEDLPKIIEKYHKNARRS